MIEIEHVEITLENFPLDEQRAGAVTTRALELLEQRCARDGQWGGVAEDLSPPPVRLGAESLSDAQVAEQVAAALHEHLAERFAGD